MNLFQFWEGPRPAYIDLAYETVDRHCSRDYEVVRLTQDTLTDWLPKTIVDLAYRIRHKPEGDHSFERVSMTRSNFLRCSLLLWNGGLWLDADAIVLKPFPVIAEQFNSGRKKFVCTIIKHPKFQKPEVPAGIIGSEQYGAIAAEWFAKQIKYLDENAYEVTPNHLPNKILTPMIVRPAGPPEDCYILPQQFSYPDWTRMRRLTRPDINKSDLNIVSDTYIVQLFHSSLRKTDFPLTTRKEALNGNALVSKLFREALQDA